MAKVRVLVLRAPGTNCDNETDFAFTQAKAVCDRIHVNRLLEAPAQLANYQILCIPGGFSFGDDVGAGKVLADILRLRLGDSLRQFRDQGRLILGICNGFQVLLKSGLLVEPDSTTGNPVATLTFNQHGRFEDRWIHLKLTAGRCAFVQADEIITLPVAHGEGNFIVENPAVLEQLFAQGRVNAQYVDADGLPGAFPINPNGAMGDVAGVCDSTGRVFALMPHPERHILPTHHPRWTRRKTQPPEGDGLRIFRNAVAYFD